MGDARTSSVVSQLVAYLIRAQKDEAFWARLDRIPDLLRWLGQQAGPWRLSAGGRDLVSVQRQAGPTLTVTVIEAGAWCQAFQWLKLVEPRLSQLLPLPQFPAGVLDAVRPAVHDAAQMVREEGWRLSIVLGADEFLVMGRGVAGSKPPGFGPCEINVPVLVRYLATIREGLTR